MSLKERIEADFKDALKNRRQEETSTLRLIRAALKNREKDGQAELDDEAVVQVLKTQAKQRRESIDQFDQADRRDLADKERAELEIIGRYLPAEVDEATMKRVVAEVIAELGAVGMKQMGQVMKESLARLGAGADGKAVNRIAREQLQAG